MNLEPMKLAWYVARLRRMSARELASRLRDEGLKTRWRRLKGRPAPIPATSPEPGPAIAWDASRLEPEIRDAILAAAEELLAGRLRILGRDVALPRSAADWFRDCDTGIAAPAEAYAFDIDARDPAVVGNHKFLLEPSRLQHVTLLAAAYFLTRRAAFAELAAAQLRSWWQANPFLTGIHWSSGIEVALRLVSFAWTRRLLDGWAGAGDCFEGSALARDQIFRHQQYLAALRSHGSSANNHLLAELLGLYVGASAFAWFPQSGRWRRTAAAALEIEAARQVFPDGLSREQASEYHGFVLELLMVAAAEGLLARQPLSADFHETIARMADAWAALLDVRRRAPRQGDTDDAQAILLDPADRERRPISLLAAAEGLVGGCRWWPAPLPDFRSRLFAALTGDRGAQAPLARPTARPHLFPDAGLVILRDPEPRADELWCRCDHGPHGYLSIAAHAHADALSVELRHGGVDILADPGTYCYLSELEFRRYFRSTFGHNTLEVGGQDQARFGGPFLWLDAPETTFLSAAGLEKGEVARWSARHAGYARQDGNPVHERSVALDRVQRRLQIADRLLPAGRFPVRLAFHLGPQVSALLDGASATLAWSAGGRCWRGRLSLPAALGWRALRGSLDPLAGWYSPRFGERVATTCLIGEGLLEGETVVETLFEVVPGS
jgi:Heparinase II/III-like protein/Heparinase II/III N-terminus